MAPSEVRAAGRRTGLLALQVLLDGLPHGALPALPEEPRGRELDHAEDARVDLHRQRVGQPLDRLVEELETIRGQSAGRHRLGRSVDAALEDALADLLRAGQHLLAVNHDHRVPTGVSAQKDAVRHEWLHGLAGRQVCDKPRRLVVEQHGLRAGVVVLEDECETVEKVVVKVSGLRHDDAARPERLRTHGQRPLGLGGRLEL